MAFNKPSHGKHARVSNAPNSAFRGTISPAHGEAFEYSRGSGRYAARANSNSPSKIKKILLIVLAVVVMLAFAGVAYGAYFFHKLNSALSVNDDSGAIEEVTSDVVSGEPFYMLVMGSDSREGSGTSNYAPNTGSNERSDVMILMRVDASNRKLTMVSIPRDTPYEYEDGTIDKLNESYNRGGAAETIKAVEKVTGVDIAHFAEVRFSDLEGMVDALGGVKVNVDTPLSYKDALTGEWVEIPQGEQILNGQQAQIFARARHEYTTDQDMHRQQNVRQLAVSMLHSVLDLPMHKIPGVVLKLAEFVGTDLKAGDILYLARMFAGGDLTLYSCTGPNLGDINHECNDMWLCYPNPEGWKKLMAVVDSGEDPSGIDVNETAQKPESSDHEAEGTYEPEVDDQGNYILGEDLQSSDGGYVEPYGTYYYYEGEGSQGADATVESYDAVSPDEEAMSQPVEEAAPEAPSEDSTVDSIPDSSVQVEESQAAE